MHKRTIRHYLMIAITGMFCWLNASVVMAQTATNLNCNWCVGPGEVANGAVRWPSLNAAVRGFLIDQANDVNAAVALVNAQEARIAALEAQIVALQAGIVPNLGTYLRIDTYNSKPAVIFEAANVLVRDGTGDTWGPTSGLGNLIVGYDEASSGGDVKTGSHNLVVGPEHTYSSYGGFVTGFNNNITAQHASVSGGAGNNTSGNSSSVSGGFSNTAEGNYSSVSGGQSNTAEGNYSSVSGGYDNAASGVVSSVSGGASNNAKGDYSSVSAGTKNAASGVVSSVSGGNSNIVTGDFASVSGGKGRKASSVNAWAAGALVQAN